MGKEPKKSSIYIYISIPDRWIFILIPYFGLHCFFSKEVSLCFTLCPALVLFNLWENNFISVNLHLIYHSLRLMTLYVFVAIAMWNEGERNGLQEISRSGELSKKKMQKTHTAFAHNITLLHCGTCNMTDSSQHLIKD